MKQVSEARAAKRKINLFPERTDMTEAQVKEFMKKPIEEVIEITKEELKDYSGSVSSIVEQINEEIDSANNVDNKTNENIVVESPPSSRKWRKKKTDNE